MVNSIYGLTGAQNAHGYYASRMGGDGGLFGTSLFANPTYTQYSLDSNVINTLGDKGFNKNLLSNPALVNYGVSKGLFQMNQDGTVNVLGTNADLENLNKELSIGQQNGTINQNGTLSNSGSGWLNKGTDQYGNSTWGGATAFQWAGAGLNAAMGLYGMYQGHKQMKLAKENFEEQKALSRANYAMQAKAYNNNLRNQQSGRSFGGMSGSAQRVLGSEYQRRKANETYR